MNRHQFAIFHDNSPLCELERMSRILSCPLEQVQHLFESCSHWVFLYAENEKGVIVLAKCSLSDSWDKIRTEISDLYVHEDYQHSGYYRLLLLNVLYYFEYKQYILYWDEPEIEPEFETVLGKPKISSSEVPVVRYDLKIGEFEDFEKSDYTW